MPFAILRMRIMPRGRAKLPAFKVSTERGEISESLRGRETPEGHIEFRLFGDRTVIVRWETEQDKSRAEAKNKNGRKGKKK